MGKVNADPGSHHEEIAIGDSGARISKPENEPVVQPRLSTVSDGHSEMDALADRTDTPASGLTEASELGDINNPARLHAIERILNSIAARLALLTYEAPPSYAS